jgi:hypothetical protein
MAEIVLNENMSLNDTATLYNCLIPAFVAMTGLYKREPANQPSRNFETPGGIHKIFFKPYREEITRIGTLPGRIIRFNKSSGLPNDGGWIHSLYIFLSNNFQASKYLCIGTTYIDQKSLKENGPDMPTTVFGHYNNLGRYLGAFPIVLKGSEKRALQKVGLQIPEFISLFNTAYLELEDFIQKNPPDE